MLIGTEHGWARQHIFAQLVVFISHAQRNTVPLESHQAQPPHAATPDLQVLSVPMYHPPHRHLTAHPTTHHPHPHPPDLTNTWPYNRTSLLTASGKALVHWTGLPSWASTAFILPSSATFLLSTNLKLLSAGHSSCVASLAQGTACMHAPFYSSFHSSFSTTASRSNPLQPHCNTSALLRTRSLRATGSTCTLPSHPLSHHTLAHLRLTWEHSPLLLNFVGCSA
jgi:hypothetical protein